MCKINLNQELNGIELSFDSKPERATLDAIKAQGFRWNGKKCVWYAKQTADRLTYAQTLGQIEEETPTTASYNLEGLGENFPGHYGGKELSEAIREDLKRRGVKGCTVRVRHYDSITVTVKATAADFASLEEFKTRYSFGEFSCDVGCHGKYTGEKWIYTLEGMTDEEKQAEYNNYCRYEIEHRHDFNNYHRERDLYPQYTTAFCEKLEAVYMIANQWNYDNSDPYTDYFDRGYYLDIDIKVEEFTARENMTDEEREAYQAEQAQKEAERAAQMAKWEREQEEARAAAKRYEEKRKQDATTVYNNIRVEDLNESEQYFVYGLLGGIGKECNLEELRKEADRDSIPALITRNVIFSDSATFETFGGYLLENWLFVSGKGGTASEDVRIKDNNTWSKLNEAQRETVDFFNNDCVAVYVGEELQLVIDPQGYNYPRYCFIPNNYEIRPAAAELERMRAESEAKRAFYFPASIAEQVKNITPGEDITIYMSDGWILTNIESGRGKVNKVYPGKWAQYEGYYIQIGNKEYFIRDGKEILIYKGVKPLLPREVTTDTISDNMTQILTTFDGLFDRVLGYYELFNEKPIVDNIQR
ncbi:MAG: hypothetical protein J5662_02090 [Clostridia bacterium]|nr:hypothetical protein [Clostridia bacterium]